MWHYWACGIIHKYKVYTYLGWAFYSVQAPSKVEPHICWSSEKVSSRSQSHCFTLHFFTYYSFWNFQIFLKATLSVWPSWDYLQCSWKEIKEICTTIFRFTNEIKTFMIILNEAGQLIQTLLSKRSYRTLDDKVTQHDGSRITHICSQSKPTLVMTV